MHAVCWRAASPRPSPRRQRARVQRDAALGEVVGDLLAALLVKADDVVVVWWWWCGRGWCGWREWMMMRRR